MTEEHDSGATRSRIDRTIDAAARRRLAPPAPATLHARVMRRIVERPEPVSPAAWLGGLVWRGAAAALILVVAVALWTLARAPERPDSRRAATESGPSIGEGEGERSAADPGPPDASPETTRLAVATLAPPAAIVEAPIAAVEPIEVTEIRIARATFDQLEPLDVASLSLTNIAPLGERR
jgi:hypothetical protein